LTGNILLSVVVPDSDTWCDFWVFRGSSL